MVAFKIISDHSLIITIIKEFKSQDLSGVSTIVDALFDGSYDKKLLFNLDAQIDMQSELLLVNYFKASPYNFQILKHSQTS